MAAIENKHYDAGGRVVYWSLNGESDFAKLREGCLAAGLREGTLPEKRSALSALRFGIDTWIKRLSLRNVLVRPLANSDGYEIVQEHTGEDQNEYVRSFVAKVDVKEPSCLPRVISGEVTYEAWSIIIDNYREALGRASQDAVGAYLSRVVSVLSGSSLKPNGGVYWLPSTSLERFSKVVDSVETAGTHGVFTLSVQHDAQLARSVTDAITAEVETESNYIESELASRDLGERALRTRIVRAKVLLEKVREYESILRVTLEPLASRLVEVETQCAVLAIQKAAAEDAVKGGA